MSWYRIVFLFGCMSFLTWAKAPMPKVEQDALIVEALVYDMYHGYTQSEKIYAKLYQQTGAQAYLFREVRASLLGEVALPQTLEHLEAWSKKHPKNHEAKRLLVSLYLSTNQFDKAKKLALWLSNHSNDVKDWEIVANIYLYEKAFSKALLWLNKVYDKTYNEKILFEIVKIMEEYTHQHTEAIQRLESHARMREVEDDQLYFLLLALYSKDKNAQGLLETYETLYQRDAQVRYLNKIVEILLYLKRPKEAITFLEKYATQSEWLPKLYRYEKEYEKSQAWLKKAYMKSKNPKWLAEEAMLLLERSPHNEEARKESLALFQKAFHLGLLGGVYWNYYGYTLIEDANRAKEGIVWVEKALKESPTNSYYLDSLAWGYYKLHQCKKAKETMEKVVEKEGLEVKEIKEHYDAIELCQ